MNRNDPWVTLFGRPVWLHCRQCNRVKAAEAEESPLAAWEEQAVAMEEHGVVPEALWWFQTICDSCQRERTSQVLLGGRLAKGMVDPL